MASGRCRQMRLHAVQQAGLVWGLFQGMRDEQVGRFVRTGTIDEAETEVMRPTPAALEQMFSSMQRRSDGQ